MSIFVFSKHQQAKFKYTRIKNIETALSGSYDNFIEIENSDLNSSNWNLAKNNQQIIFNKINKNSIQLEKIGHAYTGLTTGLDNVLMFTKNELKILDLEKEILLPVLRAENCDKYFCSEPQKFVC